MKKTFRIANHIAPKGRDKIVTMQEFVAAPTATDTRLVLSRVSAEDMKTLPVGALVTVTIEVKDAA